MIIATAGHVDHGKTTLVRALTGIDTDRLPEEKRRGLTIDLGYAYAEIDGVGTVGFVDVPGHHRFVANMAAGVSGIDAALLVVAADDGIMPQTVEHLAILDLLGIEHLLIAVTKTDRVAPERVEAVAEAARALCTGPALSIADIVRTSVPEGHGIADLRSALAALPARGHPEGRSFRLAVDRAFLVEGVGVVATGLALSGSIAVGAELLISPSGLPVTARALRAQSQPVETVNAGDRCAIQIAGRHASREAIRRGDWLVAPDAHLPSDRLDVSLRLAPDEAGLRHGTPVHVHIGAADIPGRVALLDARRLEPGKIALAQIVLDRRTSTVAGDRLVLRDQSARHTLAGATVLDPVGPRRGRARPERLAELEALRLPTPDRILRRLLGRAGAMVDLEDLRRRLNLTQSAMETACAGLDMHRVGTLVTSPSQWRAWRDAAVETIAAAHRETPEDLGVELRRVARSLGLREEPARAVLTSLVDHGRLVFSLGVYRLPDHRPRQSPSDARLWPSIAEWLGDRERAAEVVHQIARHMGAEPGSLFPVLDRAARLGLVVRVSRNRYLLPETVARLAGVAAGFADWPEGFTVRDFRDAAGIGRNLAVEVLEFLDRRRLTRRDGDRRVIIATTEAVFGRAGTC